MNIYAIIAMLFMILVFGFTGGFIYYYFVHKQNIKTKGWLKTKGICTSYESGHSYFLDNLHYNYPIITYKINNQEYLIKSRVGYSGIYTGKWGKGLIGKKFNVLYNPLNPNDAILTNSRNLNFIVFLVFLITTLLMVKFVVNDLILEKNVNKTYTYSVNCNYMGYTNQTIESIDANSSEKALNIIKEKYNTPNLKCEYTLIEDKQ